VVGLAGRERGALQAMTSGCGWLSPVSELWQAGRTKHTPHHAWPCVPAPSLTTLPDLECTHARRQRQPGRRRTESRVHTDARATCAPGRRQQAPAGCCSDARPGRPWRRCCSRHAPLREASRAAAVVRPAGRVGGAAAPRGLASWSAPPPGAAACSPGPWWRTKACGAVCGSWTSWRGARFTR
jgi:hypothetical protein